jgi:hypothetical protein
VWSLYFSFINSWNLAHNIAFSVPFLNVDSIIIIFIIYINISYYLLYLSKHGISFEFHANPGLENLRGNILSEHEVMKS